MDRTSWNTGRAFTQAEASPREGEDMEFWKNVLADRHLRSRFIRDLELQSIGSRSLEELARRDRDEELITRPARAL